MNAHYSDSTIKKIIAVSLFVVAICFVLSHHAHTASSHSSKNKVEQLLKEHPHKNFESCFYCWNRKLMTHQLESLFAQVCDAELLRESFALKCRYNEHEYNELFVIMK